MAAIETGVATELGNVARASWFIPAWTLAITVSFMIWYDCPSISRARGGLICCSGANTDLLGRRWFLVGGNVFCFIGHIVVGTAKSTTPVIVGMGMIEAKLGKTSLMSDSAGWFRGWQLSNGCICTIRIAPK